MRRREFITLVGGATAWPVAARAQQPMPVIGFLSSTSPEANPYQVRGFRQGLKEFGYVEGENVAIVYRWAETHMDRLQALAADLAIRQVSVIVTAGGVPAAFAAKVATTTIPVVFVLAQDPVALGLVASLARPGGNLTGINSLATELVAKRFALLRELVPGAKRVAVLVNPANAVATEATVREVDAAARAMELQIQVLGANNSQEIDAAFATLARERPEALCVSTSPFLTARRVQLVHWATRHAIPAIFPNREYSEVGGLISYGANLPDIYRQQGAYVARVLKGAKPTDLPVVQATRLELVINAQTARMLGLTVPDKLLVAADEVIE